MIELCVLLDVRVANGFLLVSSAVDQFDAPYETTWDGSGFLDALAEILFDSLVRFWDELQIFTSELLCRL